MDQHNELALEITDDILNGSIFPDRPRIVGASLPFSKGVVLPVVKGLIEALASNFGDKFNEIVLTRKDVIKSVVGPGALKVLDELIHEIQK